MGLIARIPMKAAKTPTEDLIHKVDKHWPMLISPKLDGIRFFVEDGVVLSNARIPLRSAFVQRMYGRAEFNNKDGELICGLPYGPGVYDRTFSAVMTTDCETPVSAYVFDSMEEGTYITRHKEIIDWYTSLGEEYDNLVRLVEQETVRSWTQALYWEKVFLAKGYEGAMLRHPRKEYKYNRSTLIGGELIKLKRFSTAEAIIVDYEELFHNGNEAFTDARGLTKRTVHQENLIPGNMLGAILAKDIASGVDMRVGGGEGMDFSLRKWIWQNRELCRGRIFRYKFLGYGEKYRPRHPQWNGWRDIADLSETYA